MVGTAQSNRTGTEVKAYIDKMKVGTYQSCFWEHKTENLVYAVWADNAVVKTLSNHHGANVLDEGNGLMQRGKDKRRAREMKQKAVPCLVQMKEYSERFHLIDKGNRVEAKYDMAGQSKSHIWVPKLVFWMFNMVQNNPYFVYKESI